MPRQSQSWQPAGLPAVRDGCVILRSICSAGGGGEMSNVARHRTGKPVPHLRACCRLADDIQPLFFPHVTVLPHYFWDTLFCITLCIPSSDVAFLNVIRYASTQAAATATHCVVIKRMCAECMLLNRHFVFIWFHFFKTYDLGGQCFWICFHDNSKSSSNTWL